MNRPTGCPVPREEGAFLNPITTDPMIRSGQPVLTGTRFPVSLILMDLAAGSTVSQIADDMSLDRELIVDALFHIAIEINARWSRRIEIGGA